MSNEARYKITAVDKTDRATKSARRSFGKLNKAVGAMAPQLAAVAGVAGFGALMKSSLSAADKIHKLNQRMGISTETLSQMQHASNLSGVEFDTTSKALERMSRSVSEASKGYGTGRKAIEDLGLNVDRLMRMKPAEQFEVFADAISGVENASDRTRMAMEIFGRSGGELLPMLRQGSAGIRDMREEADELGLTLGQKQANAAAKAQDAMARLEAAGKGVTQAFAVALGPTLAAVGNFLAKVLPHAADFTKKAFGAVIRVIGDLQSRFMETQVRVLDAIATLGSKIGINVEWVEKARDKWSEWASVVDGWGESTEIATGKVEDFAVKTGEVAEQAENLSYIWEESIPKLEAVNTELEKMVERFEVMAEPIEVVRHRVAGFGAEMTTALDAAGLGVRQFSNNASSWLTTVATEGSSAAGKFETVWRNAIDSVIASLAKLAVQWALFRGLDFVIPGAGTLLGAVAGGQSPALGRSVAPVGAGASASALPPPAVNFINNSLAPATAADRLNAYQRVNDLQRQAQPYTVAG